MTINFIFTIQPVYHLILKMSVLYCFWIFGILSNLLVAQESLENYCKDEKMTVWMKSLIRDKLL